MNQLSSVSLKVNWKAVNNRAAVLYEVLFVCFIEALKAENVPLIREKARPVAVELYENDSISMLRLYCIRE